MVEKLIEECNENIEETSFVKIKSTKCKSNSCILYIVLFSIFFTINIGIATYFVYYKHMNRNKEDVSVYDYVYQRMGTVKQIDIKIRTYCFYNDVINIKTFDSNLLKIDKKSYKDIGIYNIGYITTKKIDDYENIYM